MVKAPTAFDPTTESGYPQARDRRDYILDNMRRPEHHHRRPSPPRPTPPRSRARSSGVGNGCVSVAKNNWGFFCDYFYRWWLSQEAFGKTAYERERQLKSGGYRIVTSLDIKAQSAARERDRRRGSTTKNRNALLLAGIEPGTGRVRTLAANRKFKLDDPADPQNKISSDPAKAAEGHPRHVPEHHQPAAHRRRRHHRLPGRLGVQDVHHGGRPGEGLSARATRSRREKQYKSGYIIDVGSPAACPGTHYYCPQQLGRRRRRRRTTCGPASAGRSTPSSCRCRSGSARRTWWTWRSGSACSSAPAEDAEHREQQGRPRTSGAPSPSASPRRPRWRWRTRTPRWPATACTASRRRSRRSRRRTARSSTSASRTAPGPPRADVARAALDAARCPVGDQSQLGRCSGATAPGRARHDQAPGLRQDRHHRQGQDRRADRRHDLAGGRRLPGQPRLGRAPRPDVARHRQPGGRTRRWPTT